MSDTASLFLSRKEAANFLAELGCPVAMSTLAKWASFKKGPPYSRYGGRLVRYKKSELIRWAEKNQIRGGEELD